MPTATSGTTCGKNKNPEGRHAAAPVPGQQIAMAQAEHDRQQGEEQDQHQRVQDRPAQHGVREHPPVVVEADPGGQGDAVPVEQREIRRVQGGQHRERSRGERGQHVHIAAIRVRLRAPGDSSRGRTGRPGAVDRRLLGMVFLPLVLKRAEEVRGSTRSAMSFWTPERTGRAWRGRRSRGTW